MQQANSQSTCQQPGHKARTCPFLIVDLHSEIIFGVVSNNVAKQNVYCGTLWYCRPLPLHRP